MSLAILHRKGASISGGFNKCSRGTPSFRGKVLTLISLDYLRVDTSSGKLSSTSSIKS